MAVDTHELKERLMHRTSSSATCPLDITNSTHGFTNFPPGTS